MLIFHSIVGTSSHPGLSEYNGYEKNSNVLYVVQDFTYLGANISRDEEITSEVTRRIARAARAFGCLRVPVFKNQDLSLATKRAVYRAIVLAVLLYGAETWTMKAVHTRCLNSFHNRCIRTILDWLEGM